MNIFVLDLDPVAAARAQVDKHVVKMTLESAQLLCNAFPEAPYKHAHVHHPCAIWALRSSANYQWLLDHALALAAEYTLRYGKRHKSQDVIEWCRDHVSEISFPDSSLTPFAQAMPDEYKHPNPVQAYRNYYLGSKMRFAAWKSPAIPPSWVLEAARAAQAA